MAQSNILTKTDKCDNVEIVDEVEAIKKKRSYEGSFLGWYDIVLDWESLCAVIPIRTHTRELECRWEDTQKKIWEEEQKRHQLTGQWHLKWGNLTSHLETATGLRSLVVTLSLCSLAQNLLAGATMHPTCWCYRPIFTEEMDKKVGSEGTLQSSPLEGPWRQLRNQAGALQRSHGGGARGISSWPGIVGVGGRVANAGAANWQGSLSDYGPHKYWAGFIIVSSPAFPQLSLPLLAGRSWKLLQLQNLIMVIKPNT